MWTALTPPNHLSHRVLLVSLVLPVSLVLAVPLEPRELLVLLDPRVTP